VTALYFVQTRFNRGSSTLSSHPLWSTFFCPLYLPYRESAYPDHCPPSGRSALIPIDFEVLIVVYLLRTTLFLAELFSFQVILLSASSYINFAGPVFAPAHPAPSRIEEKMLFPEEIRTFFFFDWTPPSL